MLTEYHRLFQTQGMFFRGKGTFSVVILKIRRGVELGEGEAGFKKWIGSVWGWEKENCLRFYIQVWDELLNTHTFLLLKIWFNYSCSDITSQTRLISQCFLNLIVKRQNNN